MLRGMNDFGGDMEDGGDADDSSTQRSVSVNFLADGKRAPHRRISQDTDTESFTYEHFPVVCPTCRGVGKVHEGTLWNFLFICDAFYWNVTRSNMHNKSSNILQFTLICDFLRDFLNAF